MNNLAPDLLPAERIRALESEYYARLSILGLGFFVSVLVAGAALLAPTYLYLQDTVAIKSAALSQLTGRGVGDQAVLAGRTAALSQRANVLINVAKGRSVTALLRDVLTVPRVGVTLISFNYTPATADKPGTLLLSGVAPSRDQLHTYQLALVNTTFAAGVDLPVGAYAKDTDIPFTMTVSLKP